VRSRNSNSTPGHTLLTPPLVIAPYDETTPWSHLFVPTLLWSHARDRTPVKDLVHRQPLWTQRHFSQAVLSATKCFEQRRKLLVLFLLFEIHGEFHSMCSAQRIIVLHDGEQQSSYRYFYCIITEQGAQAPCGQRPLPYAMKPDTLIMCKVLWCCLDFYLTENLCRHYLHRSPSAVCACNITCTSVLWMTLYQEQKLCNDMAICEGKS
jgi:hypothetical protein